MLGIYREDRFGGTFPKAYASLDPAAFSNLDLSINEINYLAQTPMLIFQIDHKTEDSGIISNFKTSKYIVALKLKYIQILIVTLKKKKQSIGARCYFLCYIHICFIFINNLLKCNSAQFSEKKAIR